MFSAINTMLFFAEYDRVQPIAIHFITLYGLLGSCDELIPKLPSKQTEEII